MGRLLLLVIFGTIIAACSSPMSATLPDEAKNELTNYIGNSEYEIVSAVKAQDTSSLGGLLRAEPEEAWCVVIDRPVDVFDDGFLERNIIHFTIERRGLSWEAVASGPVQNDRVEQVWLEMSCGNW